MDIQEIKNSIFAGLLKQGVEGMELRRQEFLKVFSDPKVFEDEYYVFAIMIKEFPKIPIRKNFINAWLANNKPSIQKMSNVALQRFKVSATDDEFTEFKESVISLYDELQKVDFDNSDFYENLEIYKMNFINERSISILEESTQILAQGIKVRGKDIVGYDAMRTHLKNSFKVLDEMNEVSERRGLITYGINDVEDAEIEQNAIKLIAPYGIESLDKHIGGIWEGEMISLLAPAKGGKSRMATYILHNAVVHGVPIVMWSIENGYKGWEALIRARHFDYFYNRNLTDGTTRKWVDDDSIRKGGMDAETKQIELASWTDLKSNHAYGKISSIDEEFTYDTFIEVLDNAVKTTGAKLVCIDYLQLVQGIGAMSKHDTIASVYQKTLQYLKANKIAGIFPGQLKQQFTGSMGKMNAEDMVNMELRDSAGESYEVIKTPDVNLALYANTEELKQGKMRILSIPSRNHKPFDPIELNCELGSCTFYDASATGKD